jgi:hypothetical protein
MSDVNAGTSADPMRGRPAEPTGWVGWIIFAGIMMMLLGTFHIFEGFIALFHKSYYIVGQSGLTINVNYTTWGWVQIFAGLFVFVVGAALISGSTWARVVGIGLAFLSAIVNIGFLSSMPVWGAIMVTIDILVIWALTVHGSEMKTQHELDTQFR